MQNPPNGDRGLSDLHQWIFRVTESETAPAKQKYVVKILTLLWETRTTQQCWDILNERPLALDANVCLKAMILLHRMMIDGPHQVLVELHDHLPMLTNLQDVWALTATKDHMHDLVVAYIGYIISQLKLHHHEPNLHGNNYINLEGHVGPTLVGKLHSHLAQGLILPQKMLSEKLLKIRSIVVSALVLIAKENHARICLLHHILSAEHLTVADRNQQTHQFEQLYKEVQKYLDAVFMVVPGETRNHLPNLPPVMPSLGDFKALPFPINISGEEKRGTQTNGHQQEESQWIPSQSEGEGTEQRGERRRSQVATGVANRMEDGGIQAPAPPRPLRGTMAAMGNISSTEQQLEVSEKRADPLAPPRPRPQPPKVSKSTSRNFVPARSYLQVDLKEISVGDRIGIGSFAEVFKGSWRGTKVAVKKLLPQNMTEDAYKEYQSEVEVMQRLRHPNVVLFMGSISQPDCLGIVMEYMPRGTLFELLHESKMELSFKQLLRFACDSARGMTYLHLFQPPIIHRDLKSLNLMIDAHFNVKLTDFGLSKAKSAQSRPMTARCGTYQWMAPELVQGHFYNEKVDIFSFGIVLWELVSRQPPYLGMPDIQVGMGVVKGLRPTIPPDCPAGLSRLMQECWQSSPDVRPSAITVLRQLEAMLESL